MTFGQFGHRPTGPAAWIFFSPGWNIASTYFKLRFNSLYQNLIHWNVIKCFCQLVFQFNHNHLFRTEYKKRNWTLTLMYTVILCNRDVIVRRTHFNVFEEILLGNIYPAMPSIKAIKICSSDIIELPTYLPANQIEVEVYSFMLCLDYVVYM